MLCEVANFDIGLCEFERLSDTSHGSASQQAAGDPNFAILHIVKRADEAYNIFSCTV